MKNEIITERDLGLEVLEGKETEFYSKDNDSMTIRYGARGIVIDKEGKIAVIYKKNKNEYKLPGGGVDKGEDFKEAFKRECMEEIGCSIENVEYLFDIEEDHINDNFKQISKVYIAKVKEKLESNNLTEQAKEIGLISEIVDGDPEITTETVAMMQACGCKSLPKPNKVINSKNIEKMDRDTLISALGMAANATDEQIKERIQALKEQETKRAVEAKDRAEKLVNKAIFDKKITADKKDLYVGLAEADYDKTATLLEAIEAPRPASQTITPTKSAVEDRSTWTMEDYLTKDPDALEALMVSDPQKVRELNAMYQRKNK